MRTPPFRGKGSSVPAGPPGFDDADTRAGSPRCSRSPDSQRQARIPSSESTLRRLQQRASAVASHRTMLSVFQEELRLALCLTPGKQAQRRGTPPRHTSQRIRNKRHDDVHILCLGELEALELRMICIRNLSCDPKGSERKQGFSAEQVPVSTYGGV